MEFGLAAFPYFQGGKVLTPTGSRFMGVSANSANTDIAADFARFLTHIDDDEKVWVNGAKVPANDPGPVVATGMTRAMVKTYRHDLSMMQLKTRRKNAAIPN